MKKKVALWVAIFLVNAVVGVVSFRTYQNMNARITEAEKLLESTISVESFNSMIIRGEMNAVQGQVDQLIKDVLTESVLLGNDGKYDYNNVLIKHEDLNKFFDYKVYVRTKVILETSQELLELDPDLPKNITKTVEASATVIGRYVLMASHTNDVERFSRQTVDISTPVATFKKIFESKVLEYKVTLLMADGSEHSLKELYRSKEKDFTLFEMSASLAPNFPFIIGKSDELSIGHFVYINGRPSVRFEVARPGFVTSLENPPLDGAIEGKKDYNQFHLSQSTDHGDSGSPIVAFRDGKPELVGIYLGWYSQKGDNGNNTRSRALKINAVAQEIKEKLGIDLRELQRKVSFQ